MVRSVNTRAPAPPGVAQPELEPAPPPGARGDVMRRLQIGTVGIIGVLLLIGLASIIEDRAKQTDSTAVAEAVPAATGTASASPPDPLAQAGVLPDMPTSPSPAQTAGFPESPATTDAR